VFGGNGGGGSWHCLVEMIGALKAVSFGIEMEGGRPSVFGGD
jgi:hypothetical protein